MKTGLNQLVTLDFPLNTDNESLSFIRSSNMASKRANTDNTPGEEGTGEKQQCHFPKYKKPFKQPTSEWKVYCRGCRQRHDDYDNLGYIWKKTMYRCRQCAELTTSTPNALAVNCSNCNNHSYWLTGNKYDANDYPVHPNVKDGSTYCLSCKETLGVA